jgi:hypothetical protein
MDEHRADRNAAFGQPLLCFRDRRIEPLRSSR